MDFAFSSQKELYERVLPALHAKEVELHRLGYTYIKSTDIWNYHIETKWKKGKDLVLSDIVNDIMQTDGRIIDGYLKGKLEKVTRTQYFSDKEMI